MGRRTDAGLYSIDEKPNLVAKLHVTILAADLATWGDFQSRGMTCDHPHLLECAARWIDGRYENARQCTATQDAEKAAWSVYRMLKDVCKLDMNAIEREAKRARWWR